MALCRVLLRRAGTGAGMGVNSNSRSPMSAGGSGWVRALNITSTDAQLPSTPSSSSSSDAQPISNETILPEEGEEEDLLKKMRNKSRLHAHHYKAHHSLPTRITEDEEIVQSLNRQRRRFGLYGAASGVDVAKLWPSKEELELQKEYEKVARPHTVQEMISMARKAKQEEEEAIQKRQADIKRKMLKLEDWKREVRERIARQEQEAQEAKAKKERLIEEVRMIVGYQVDPKDEKFKEALLKKEQEEKKAKKAAKKLRQQQRLIERLRMGADPEPAPPQDSAAKKEQQEGDSSSSSSSSSGSGVSHGSPVV